MCVVIGWSADGCLVQELTAAHGLKTTLKAPSSFFWKVS